MFKIKFEKSKYPIFKIAFWIIFISSIILILNIIRIKAFQFSINNIYPTKQVSANFFLTRKLDDNFLICFDNYCKTPEANSLFGSLANYSNIYSARYDESDDNFFNTKIKNVYFAYPKNTQKIENKLEKITVYVGDDSFEYTIDDFKKMKSKEISIIFDNSEEKLTYNAYTLNISNPYRGLLNHFYIIILSFIFNWKDFIVPYSWLFVVGLIFLFNKDVFKITIKTKTIILSSIFVLYSFLFAISYFNLPKNTNDFYMNYIQNDIQNYKNHDIYIISNKTEDYLNKYPKIKEIGVNWRYIDLNKEKPLAAIKRNDFVKNNKKTVVYGSSEAINFDTAIMSNGKLQVIDTGLIRFGKLVY